MKRPTMYHSYFYIGQCTRTPITKWQILKSS